VPVAPKLDLAEGVEGNLTTHILVELGWGADAPSAASSGAAGLTGMCSRNLHPSSPDQNDPERGSATRKPSSRWTGGRSYTNFRPGPLGGADQRAGVMPVKDVSK
jgi:hypothetical protein